MTERVLIDACVLFPPLVRSIIIELAGVRLFQPLWSQRILNEWRLAVVSKHGIGVEIEVIAAQAVLSDQFPTACVEAADVLEDQFVLPDPADAHVLAAAIAGEADALLTFNLKDFPQRIASRFDVEIVHPDGFLWKMLSGQPEAVAEATHRAFEQAEIPLVSQRNVLKRARLSRFAKALEAFNA